MRGFGEELFFEKSKLETSFERRQHRGTIVRLLVVVKDNLCDGNDGLGIVNGATGRANGEVFAACVQWNIQRLRRAVRKVAEG